MRNVCFTRWFADHQVGRHTTKLTWEDLVVLCHSSTDSTRSVLQLLELGSVLPVWKLHFLLEYLCDHTPPCHAGHWRWCGLVTWENNKFCEGYPGKKQDRPPIQVFSWIDFWPREILRLSWKNLDSRVMQVFSRIVSKFFETSSLWPQICFANTNTNPNKGWASISNFLRTQYAWHYFWVAIKTQKLVVLRVWQTPSSTPISKYVVTD